MNYIKEINAFYNSIEYKPLSSSAITLWHALMHINNKTRWKCKFRVAGVVLRIKSGLTESSFKRARTELKEKGYISYEPQGGNQAPIYQIISLIENNVEEQQVNSDMDGIDVVSTETELADENVAKQVECVGSQAETTGKTVTKKNAEEKGVFRFYQDNFGVISPYVKDSLNVWIRDIGETLVMEAMKRALDRNKTS